MKAGQLLGWRAAAEPAVGGAGCWIRAMGVETEQGCNPHSKGRGENERSRLRRCSESGGTLGLYRSLLETMGGKCALFGGGE